VLPIEPASAYLFAAMRKLNEKELRAELKAAEAALAAATKLSDG
jgi:hypothetical protein